MKAYSATSMETEMAGRNLDRSLWVKEDSTRLTLHFRRRKPGREGAENLN